jgi:hypothetical protein
MSLFHVEIITFLDDLMQFSAKIGQNASAVYGIGLDLFAAMLKKTVFVLY